MANSIDTSIKFLDKCWKEVKSGKNEDKRQNSKGIDLVSLTDFENNIDDNLQKISESLSKQIYKPSPLKGFFVSKSTKGKYRLVLSPTIEDRIVQRAILKLIQEQTLAYIITGVSYGGIPKNRIITRRYNHITAIKKVGSHIENSLFNVFESDISSFYDSIPKKDLLEKLFKIFQANKYTKSLIESYIYFEVGNEEEIRDDKKFEAYMLDKDLGISQGSSLSPYFSNLYLKDFDTIVKKYYDDRLIRYVDDFIIFTKNNENPKNLVNDTLGDLGLSIKDTKTKFVNLLDTTDKFIRTDKGFERENSLQFIGLSISKYHIEQKEGKEDKVKNFLDSYNIGKLKMQKRFRSKDDKTIIKYLNDVTKGFVSFYSNYHCDRLFNHFDQRIKTKGIIELATSKSILNKMKNKKPIFSEDKWQELFRY